MTTGEWHWGDDAQTEQHVGTPGECGIPSCTAPRPVTLDDLPMGGCARWRDHFAHLAAGSSVCENQR